MSSTPVFDILGSQPRVQSYLSRVAEDGSYSHAYLFIAPPGSLKGETSRALAAAALCESGGCGLCDSCIRVAHSTHPDVHITSPDGATYMVDQVRQLAHDSMLAPIRGKRKIYVLERADLLGESAASALLKTLEEPPANVIFILQARSESAVLPTIVSRCQVVPFRRTSPREAVATLAQETGARPEDAVAAYAATGGVLKQAHSLLMSPSRWQRRTEVLTICAALATMDDLDVLNAAKDLLGIVKASADELRGRQEEVAEDQSDFLSREAIKKLEQQQKRDISSKERDTLTNVFNVIESYFKDCAMRASGSSIPPVNHDMAHAIARTSGCNLERFAVIDRALEKARMQMTYNVNPQLILESLLFDIKEVLNARGSGGQASI